MSSLFRSTWMRVLLKGVHYRSRDSRFDTLYRVENPWNMDDAGEQFRFEETNRLIAAAFGRVGSLLEIGCGEGHQSQALAQICESLQGLDVSKRAVERARKRCPKGTFVAGDMFTCNLLKDGRKYDLVVACEVLFYMVDVRAAVARMGELGERCFITYYEGQADRIEPFLKDVAGAERASFTHGDKAWRAMWWTPQT